MALYESLPTLRSWVFDIAVVGVCHCGHGQGKAFTTDDTGAVVIVRRVNHSRIPPPFQPVDIVRVAGGEPEAAPVAVSPSRTRVRVASRRVVSRRAVVGSLLQLCCCRVMHAVASVLVVLLWNFVGWFGACLRGCVVCPVLCSFLRMLDAPDQNVRVCMCVCESSPPPTHRHASVVS